MKDWTITDHLHRLRANSVTRLNQLLKSMRWTNQQYARFVKTYYGRNTTHPHQDLSTHQLQALIPVLEAIREQEAENAAGSEKPSEA